MMIRLFLLLPMILWMMLLGGCATISPQAQFLGACSTYATLFQTAVQLRSEGKLNQAQIQQVTLMDQSITPLCTNPMPSDPVTATQSVTRAITTLTILESVK